MPETRLAGLNARVTGSDRGIGKAMAMQADLSRTRDIASIVEQRVEKLASINRRVNNAGAIMQPAHREPMSDGTWDQALNVYVKSGSMMMR